MRYVVKHRPNPDALGGHAVVFDTKIGFMVSDKSGEAYSFAWLEHAEAFAAVLNLGQAEIDRQKKLINKKDEHE